MFGVNDAAAIASFLFARLSADTDIGAILGSGDDCRLYPDLGPVDENGDPSGVVPYVTYSFNAARQVRNSGRRQRLLSSHLLVVQAWTWGQQDTAEADFGTVEELMQLIDGSLAADDAQGSVTVNGVAHWVSVVGLQDGIPRSSEYNNGQWFRSVGRIYRVNSEGGG